MFPELINQVGSFSHRLPYIQTSFFQTRGCKFESLQHGLHILEVCFKERNSADSIFFLIILPIWKVTFPAQHISVDTYLKSLSHLYWFESTTLNSSYLLIYITLSFFGRSSPALHHRYVDPRQEIIIIVLNFSPLGVTQTSLGNTWFWA